MEILTPILVLAIIALVCAVLLTLSAAFFGVEENENIPKIRECLPGANCGACGFSGCDGYAKALAEGVTDNPSLCTPGGDGTSREVAAIMGLTPSNVVERVAYVACNGSRHPEEKKYDYNGPKSCAAAKLNLAGDRHCSFACLGYGDCVAVCPRDAIKINAENCVAEIDPKKCIGCSLCVKTCPNGIISLVDDTRTVVVKCKNQLKGADVRLACNNGCIGCRKCEKSCPAGAIKVENNLAVIDYEKCTDCGICHSVCPVKCIHHGNFICGSHFE